MILTRTEYGTDGNVYELSISNGEEYKTQKMIPIEVLQGIRQEIEIQRKGFPPSADYYKAINRSLDIVDKHIKEYTKTE